MNNSYCVKCKKRTNNIDPKYEKTHNGRGVLRSTCPNCNMRKCVFCKLDLVNNEKSEDS